MTSSLYQRCGRRNNPANVFRILTRTIVQFQRLQGGVSIVKHSPKKTFLEFSEENSSFACRDVKHGCDFSSQANIPECSAPLFFGETSKPNSVGKHDSQLAISFR
ncbi:hypothetical protein MTO96_037276 [Rhipicephalus appendiculatus]